MHVPGVNFNNRNWPHIVQALRLSLCLNMILLPILNLLISSMAVAVWENIGKYVFLAIMLFSGKTSYTYRQGTANSEVSFLITTEQISSRKYYDGASAISVVFPNS